MAIGYLVPPTSLKNIMILNSVSKQLIVSGPLVAESTSEAHCSGPVMF
jgi:hypothetical protein